jgi:YidC/Oxa1 family membrane protein insertase
MFATQWMTSKQNPPTGPQAQQQKVFLWLMPIMFTVFLKNTPSGLQLYILVSNLLSMLQNKIVYGSLNKKS